MLVLNSMAIVHVDTRVHVSSSRYWNSMQYLDIGGYGCSRLTGGLWFGLHWIDDGQCLERDCGTQRAGSDVSHWKMNVTWVFFPRISPFQYFGCESFSSDCWSYWYQYCHSESVNSCLSFCVQSKSRCKPNRRGKKSGAQKKGACLPVVAGFICYLLVVPCCCCVANPSATVISVWIYKPPSTETHNGPGVCRQLAVARAPSFASLLWDL